MSIDSMDVWATATVSLVELVDKKILCNLRDGRNLIGTMRSFDQYANVVIEDCVERIFVGMKYCEKPLGTFIVRGDNVVLLGEMDIDHEESVGASKLDLIPAVELMELKRAEDEKVKAENQVRRMMNLGPSTQGKFENV
eukprot:TRINITY_DN11040_c0_g1_i1.p1 TRINITY_DN11040_c0_g1~~TRINITY_DN11040_c0_g1_i1.p1  ORF type:complete len:151 (-),score=42.04 TRINITY_DN11040_c0_g1_i1:195-611(-)